MSFPDLSGTRGCLSSSMLDSPTLPSQWKSMPAHTPPSSLTPPEPPSERASLRLTELFRGFSVVSHPLVSILCFRLTISHRYLCLCTPCHLCFALARYSSRYFSVQGGRRGGRPEGQGEAPERQSLAATLELGSESYKASDCFFMSSLSIVLRLSFLHLVSIMHISNDSTTLGCVRIFPKFARSQPKFPFTLDGILYHSYSNNQLTSIYIKHFQTRRSVSRTPINMSRISQAQNLIRSLAPTPLRTSNSQQLNAALENITNKAFPSASSITAGSREEKALDGMVASLERLRAGKAMTDVSPPFYFVLCCLFLWRRLADANSTHYRTRR
jgi:hypothetical protein